MPLVQFQTNKFLSSGGSEAAALELSKLIAETLNKQEAYVQVVVEGGKTMTFGGTLDPNAFIKLSSLGLKKEIAAGFARRLCHFAEERFSIPADRVYIKMDDHPRAYWGWNGGTFE